MSAAYVCAKNIKIVIYFVNSVINVYSAVAVSVRHLKTFKLALCIVNDFLFESEKEWEILEIVKNSWRW